MYFKNFEKDECCACTACQQICPTESIVFKTDIEGFKYPLIDHTTCVNCGLCERVCPIENPKHQNNVSPLVYAAKLIDSDEIKKSSSGGIFYAIAKWVLENKGIVYGAAFDNNMRLRHIGITTLNDLQLLRGSKYLQSDLENVFAEIKSYLKQECWVYFVGTGCQVAGLKSFLRKEYTKLVTSDLVCHGVPSQKMFDIHLSYLEGKYNMPIKGYQFRNNETWGGCEIVDFINRKGKIKRIVNPSYELSPYLYSFMYAMTYRYSCYNCKFACIPRQGDLTLADYWGVEKFFPQIDCKHGVSLVLINNEKGKFIWEQINKGLEFYQSNVDNAATFNGNLIRKTEKPAIREGIYERIEKEGYGSLVKTIFRNPKYKRLKLILKIQHIPIIKDIYSIYYRIKSYLITINK